MPLGLTSMKMLLVIDLQKFRIELDVPLPTYPYGKSLYKPYLVGIYGL